MTRRSNTWNGALPRAVLFAVVASLTPLPVAAAETRPTVKDGPIRAAVAKVGDADAVKARSTSAAKRSDVRTAQQGAGQDRSFFRTKPGIIALAVMAVGVGYALYSSSNDRITSPGKE